MSLVIPNTSIIPFNEEPMGDYRNLGPRRVLSSWLGSIAVLGLFGNVLVVLAVALFPKLRTITNVFITSLAVSDILMSLTIPWIVVGLVSTKGWPFPPETCILVAILRFTCSGSSVWHLVAIGFNRMILITTPPATYKKIYSRINTTICLVVTWMIPFCTIVVPFASGLTRLGYDGGPHLCSDLEDNPDGTQNFTHTYLAATLLTCIPLVITLLVYFRIYLHIRQHVRRQNAWGTLEQQQQTSAVPTVTGSAMGPTPTAHKDSAEVDHEYAPEERCPSNSAAEPNSKNLPTAIKDPPPARKGNTLENRITKNMFFVVLGFIICILPYGIFVLSSNHIRIRGTPFAQGFLLFNVCMNPLIYGTKHPHFRSAIRNILGGRLSTPFITSNTVMPASQHTQSTS